MNKIYRLVWNRSLRAPVVASELATRSVGGSSRTPANAQVLTTALASAIIAILAVPPEAQAIVGITRQAVGGTTCESDADDRNAIFSIENDANCHPQAGTGLSGVGDPGIRDVQVNGYADRIGDDTANQWLSQRRAETVRNVLIAYGLPAEAVSAHGRGESQSLTDCSASLSRAALVACLAPDRRVEIVARPAA